MLYDLYLRVHTFYIVHAVRRFFKGVGPQWRRENGFGRLSHVQDEQYDDIKIT